jgi:hypothetical protein
VHLSFDFSFSLPGDMESWIKALLMALNLSLTSVAKRRTEMVNFNMAQPHVYSVRGLMCMHHHLH